MKTQKEANLSICIVTRNAKKYLYDLLTSIKKTIKEHSFELIVVDNDSIDNTQNMLFTNFPDVISIVNRPGIGFSKGINQAIKKSSGKYILILTPDTIVLPNTIDTMIEFIDAHPEVNVVGPKILNPDGTIQFSSKKLPSIKVFFLKMIRFDRIFPKNKILAEQFFTNYFGINPVEVESITGGFLMTKRSVLEEMDLFDEQFFIYFQDIDLCYRVFKKGWKLYFLPNVEVIHYRGGGGTDIESKNMIKVYHRDLYCLYKKHYANKHCFLINWICYFGIYIDLVIKLLFNSIRKTKKAR